MAPLILKRAPIAWHQDDYDVLENGVVVGRIFKVPIAPHDRTWMWASGRNGHIRRTAHGYEPLYSTGSPKRASTLRWKLPSGSSASIG